MGSGYRNHPQRRLNVSSITGVNSATGNQTTTYTYGATLADSDIAASTLKRAETYPDSVDSDDKITFEYNRQREITKSTDQNGTVHQFDFDALGRQTQDRVTTLGTGVNAAVRRIATTFEVRGMREKITSYDNAAVGSGAVDNEVQFAYNDFGQLITDYQEHGAVVNTSTSPKVQYGYASGSGNTIRPTSMTYPDGRVLTHDYGTSDATDDAVSRVSALVDDDGGSTHLAEYSYLGAGAFVETDYTEPDLRHTLVGTAGGNDPDTGDIYLGLDRFGRVKDSMWYDYGASADADRVKHGYDRIGNRTYREQTVDANSNYDERYQYDQIDRLKQSDRGTLSGSKDSISSLNFAQCWSLDSTGNWKDFKQDDDGDSTWDLEQSRTSNTVNEITNITETSGPAWITPLYNRAGNMTRIPQPSDPTQYYTVTYDAWNRLAKLEDGVNTVAEYLYDGAKRRTIKKTYVSGSLDETRHFYYTEPSKWQVIEERLDSSSNPDRQFVWGLRYIDDLILRDRDTSDPKNGALDERLYAMQDANWNVTALADTTGSVQERFAYDAYGTPRVLTPSFTTRATSSYAWETRFAGYRWDSGVALFHVRNRVYIPGLGWLQRDPMRYADALNLYQYVSGRSTVKLDPLGNKMIGGDPTDACIMDCEDTCYELYGDWFWFWEYPAYVGCVAGCPSGCNNEDFSLCGYWKYNLDDCDKWGLQCYCGIIALGDLANIPGLDAAFRTADCICDFVTAVFDGCRAGQDELTMYASPALMDCMNGHIMAVMGFGWLAQFKADLALEIIEELIFSLEPGNINSLNACKKWYCQC